ncbi:MAG: hypothetical protein IPH07_05970 [Deltaproteobacteria bacterium]|nr:hypothetical protein [Deltaproteobacteria bacterium]MBP7291361.1 hypothetical protein [Nannocystaceae bacterium]
MPAFVPAWLHPVAVILALATAAPAGAAAAPAGTAAAPAGVARSGPTAQPALDAGEYDVARAEADVTVVLTDQSRAYLQARARLVQHAELGKAALLARLGAVPPPTSAERKRLFDVLAECGGADVAARVGDELRAAVLREAAEVSALAAAETWRPVLRDLGEHAHAALAKLVADRELPLAIRAVLLDDLVQLTPDAGVAELLVLAGRGETSLRQQFTRSMRRRLRGSAKASAAVLAAIDGELERAEATRLPALIQLRAAVIDGADPGFVQRLAGWSLDDQRPFAVRVAAVRGLAAFAGDDDGEQREAARAALQRVAAATLPATTQAHEILAWLSLQALPPAQTGALAQRHGLDRSPAPRLSALAWATMPLPGGTTWLSRALDDPWPSVRTSALDRVAGPCERKLVGSLRARVGGVQDGADAEPIVQRAAIGALSRCGDAAFPALVDMLTDDAVATELSTEAARALARSFGARGADAVAKVLAGRPEAGYARRLAQSLRHATHPTPKVQAVLCAWVREGGEVGGAAAGSLDALWSEGVAVCEDDDDDDDARRCAVRSASASSASPSATHHPTRPRRSPPARWR